MHLYKFRLHDFQLLCTEDSNIDHTCCRSTPENSSLASDPEHPRNVNEEVACPKIDNQAKIAVGELQQPLPLPMKGGRLGLGAGNHRLKTSRQAKSAAASAVEGRR